MESKEVIISELQTPKPVLIKEVLLICPGNWNGVDYTSEELGKAFENTDWENKSNTHLYLDHQDTQKRGVGNWAGFVKNIKLVANDLYGDLEIWNLEMATYLKAAKAKFGISATLKGFFNEKLNRMENFKYESFSIVTEPACAPAYINLSEESETKEKTMTVTLGKLRLDNISKPIQIEGGIENKMPEKKEKLEEEEAKEKSEEESKEEPKEEAKAEPESKEAPEKEKEDELSNKVDALTMKLDKLISVLEKSLQEEKPAEEAPKEEASEKSEDESEEKEDELAAVKKQLAELHAKVMKPARKTLSATGASNSDPDVGMLNFLKGRI